MALIRVKHTMRADGDSRLVVSVDQETIIAKMRPVPFGMFNLEGRHGAFEFIIFGDLGGLQSLHKIQFKYCHCLASKKRFISRTVSVTC